VIPRNNPFLPGRSVAPSPAASGRIQLAIAPVAHGPGRRLPDAPSIQPMPATGVAWRAVRPVDLVALDDLTRSAAQCRLPGQAMAADGMRHEVEEPIPPRIPLVEGAPGKDKEFAVASRWS
jgi:hypothetical protein